ncbi:hypothetical protein PR048_016251 [Dryococelus australis]|uniref:Uncharacterized protein n=1 Tax=Dryococelus australis TaxID=614101 RepID=A0ABQ9HJM0_9NEOP|nr:hypothetical protein PR048_016251 [Dryococelus australis]
MVVKDNKLCFNFLSPAHVIKLCKSGGCKMYGNCITLCCIRTKNRLTIPVHHKVSYMYAVHCLSCSQSNFISENLVKRLQLERTKNQVHIKG